MPPEYRARIEASRPRLYAMAREQYGLELNVGIFESSSRDALIGAKYAEAQGLSEAYHSAVFRAFWQEAGDIGERARLVEAAEKVGLDGTAFLAALDDEKYRADMLADVEQARMYGLHSVPALVFNNKYLVSGAQPYEALVQVTERVKEETWNSNT